MNEGRINSSHEDRTRGGWYGHVFRRLVHLFCLTFFTVGFYGYFPYVEKALQWQKHPVLIVSVIVILLLDLFRIRCRFIFPGQRYHERQQLSSAAWSLLGLCVVFYFIDHLGYALAIALTSALVDPFNGECQRFLSKKFTYLLGAALSMFIWLCCASIFGFPYWWSFILGPAAVLAEYPCLVYMDDNFMMMVVPLLLLKCFE